MGSQTTRKINRVRKWNAFTRMFPRQTITAEVYAVKTLKELKETEGKIGYILLWLLGIPIPILFAIFLLRGCT